MLRLKVDISGKDIKIERRLLTKRQRGIHFEQLVWEICDRSNW